MFWSVITTAVIVVVIFAIYIRIAIFNVEFAKSLENMVLEECPESIPPEKENDWAIKNQYEFIGHFNTQIGNINTEIHGWQHRGRPSFFCKYLVRSGDVENTAYDLVTDFENNMSLTTASSKDAHFHPKPDGRYNQSFSDLELEQLYACHIESELFLTNFGGAVPARRTGVFQDELIAASRRQVKFTRTFFLWPLRWPYWMFIRKGIWHGKSIKTQYEAGMIKLPKELAAGDTVLMGDNVLRSTQE